MRKFLILVSGLALIYFFSATASANLSDGLVAYYPLDGNFTDASGYGHDLTAEAGFTYSWVPGIFGQALDVAPQNAHDSPHKAGVFYSGVGGWTIAAWIFLDHHKAQIPFRRE